MLTLCHLLHNSMQNKQNQEKPNGKVSEMSAEASIRVGTLHSYNILCDLTQKNKQDTYFWGGTFKSTPFVSIKLEQTSQ